MFNKSSNMFLLKNKINFIPKKYLLYNNHLYRQTIINKNLVRGIYNPIIKNNIIDNKELIKLIYPLLDDFNIEKFLLKYQYINKHQKYNINEILDEIKEIEKLFKNSNEIKINPDKLFSIYLHIKQIEINNQVFKKIHDNEMFYGYVLVFNIILFNIFLFIR